jgi:hypothetical protein
MEVKMRVWGGRDTVLRRGTKTGEGGVKGEEKTGWRGKKRPEGSS